MIARGLAPWDFYCNAHLYLSHIPEIEDDLSWLALMQHYGAPSRLLDFTFSPYIAAFFALEESEGDCAIYAIKHSKLKKEDIEIFGKGSQYKEIYNTVMNPSKGDNDVFVRSFEPKFSNERLMAQQGVFLIPDNLILSHESILRDYDIDEKYVVKYIIPSKLRASGLRHLHQMNIKSNILYPGLEGFCKSMKFQPLFGLSYQQRVE